MNVNEGDVVICPTSQAGTVIQIADGDAWVLLRNANIWVGSVNRIRLPQDQSDLDAAPVEVERQEIKRSFRED